MNLHFMLFTVLLPAVVAIAVYGISLPNLQNGLMFAVSAVLGAVIIFEIQYILGMVAFSHNRLVCKLLYNRFYDAVRRDGHPALVLPGMAGRTCVTSCRFATLHTSRS